MAESRSSELFTGFILSLQMSVLMHMGKIMSPMTGKVERDMPQAKETIDLLGVIEEKTRGNLPPDEVRLLQRILFELRMNYVEELEKETKASRAETPVAEEPRVAEAQPASQPQTPGSPSQSGSAETRPEEAGSS